MSFWNSGGCGRVLVASTRRWREQRMRISQFTAYSLLFTVLGGGEKLGISIMPDAAEGCTESSVARRPLVKKFAVKFADKFAVPRAPVNYARFKLHPLLYRQLIHFIDINLMQSAENMVASITLILEITMSRWRSSPPQTSLRASSTSWGSWPSSTRRCFSWKG